MRRQMVAGMVVAILIAGYGCEDKPPQTEEPSDEPVEIAEIKAKPPVAETDPEPEAVEPQPVAFSTWPGLQKQMTFELMWLGGDDKIDLFEEPRPDAEVVARAGWLDGQEFQWLSSVVYVEKPRPYRVHESTQILVTPYDIEYGELEADEELYDLEVGDEIFLYQYGGEGTCYLWIEARVVLSDCPHEGIDVGEDELEAEEQWTPLAEQWWVEVEGEEGAGWFLVDEAPVSVHARELEGYDDIEGIEEFEPVE